MAGGYMTRAMMARALTPPSDAKPRYGVLNRSRYRGIYRVGDKESRQKQYENFIGLLRDRLGVNDINKRLQEMNQAQTQAYNPPQQQMRLPKTKFQYDEKMETFKPVRYNADNATFMHSSKANGARKQVKPKIRKSADVAAAQNFFNSVNKYRQGV